MQRLGVQCLGRGFGTGGGIRGSWDFGMKDSACSVSV